MARHLPFLLDADPTAPFPPAAQALRDPDGLLAIGGDLAPQRLLNAYAHGIFPWFSQDPPILWGSPDARKVFRAVALPLSARVQRCLC
ncbi:leucyl/phenylalanyl-tRNA--protein transferase, partial [Xanthomonas sp. LMG 8992]|nr:leucyl/phenylalanyl-tRNA--protein transferase [Xanthomonas sp. LMG 8992]